MTMPAVTRRSFNKQLLGSLVAYGLIETLFERDLFGDAVKPVVGRWLADINTLGQDLKGQKLKDVEFQAKLEELYKKVDLPELLRLVELDRLAARTTLPDSGAASLGIDLAKVEGLPKKTVFGRQIFAMKKGRSVVPHGHNNMCTGFVVLRGDFRGRHYDKVETHPDHYLIRPTIDRRFKPGEFSTVSDHRDNVHWFTAESDTGYIFNVHVMNYDQANGDPSGRLYLDPVGEKAAGGLVVAKKLTSAECHKKYG